MLISYIIAFCRITIGLVFAWSIVGKLRDYSSFVQTIDSFKILPKTLHYPAAILFLGCELTVVGTMIFGGELFFLGFLLAAVLLVIFIIAMMSVLSRKIQVSCNCFGSSEKLVSSSDIIRNVILVLFSLGSYGLLVRSAGNLLVLGWLNWGLVSIVAILFVMILLQLKQILQLFR
jgi:hypothetical protein